MTAKIEVPNLYDFVHRYAAGASLKQLAEEARVSRQCLGRQLVEQGVILRGRSEAERRKWQALKETPQGVEQQCGAAWAAARRRNPDLKARVITLATESELTTAAIARRLGYSKAWVYQIAAAEGVLPPRPMKRRAFTRMRSLAAQRPIEAALIAELGRQGVPASSQLAIDRYSSGIALLGSQTVVEIVRRGLTDSKRMRRERLEQIFNAGWRLLVVHDGSRQGIELAAVAEQIVAYHEMLCADPAAPGQYRVIRRDGQVATRARRHFDGFAIMPQPDPRDRAALDARSG